MTLRSLKKHPTTVPSRTAARKILRALKMLALNGAAIAAVQCGASWLLASEPPLLMPTVNAKPIEEVRSAGGVAVAGANQPAVGSLSLNQLEARRLAWANEQAAVAKMPNKSSGDSSLKWRAAGTTSPPVAPVTLRANQPATMLLVGPENGLAAGECAECRATPASATADVAGTRGVSNSVRLVADQQEIDPFTDPFGDKQAQRSVRVAQGQFQPANPLNQPQPELGPALQPLPLPDEVPADPLTPTPDALPTPNDLPERSFDQPTPAPPLNGEPTPAAPMNEPLFNPNDQPPSQSDRQPRSLEGLIPPSNGLRDSNGDFLSKDGNCGRQYNGKPDCCDSDKECSKARTAVLNADIRNISLDITARFEPSAESWEEDYELRDERLQNAASRQWMDRSGRVLAQGRLIDLAHGKAVIEADSGTVVHLPLNILADDETCFINSWWDLPAECVAKAKPLTPRAWEPATFTFAASGLCHKPLYFEEVQAERYGHVAGPFIQPVISGAHFFLNVAVLPYKMGINPPFECQYALGYYRPGSCAPWMIPPIPLSLRGAIAQTGVVVGGVFLLP